MATRQPQFLRSAEQLDKWLERFNPLRGATLQTLSGYFDDADEGRFANLMWMARKMIRRDETIRACVKRIYAQLMKLKWEVKIMATLPTGISEAQAKAQAEHLKQQYEQIENLKAAAAFSALADFHGFAHLEKHYGDKGQVTRLQPVPQWHWVRAGLYGAWQFNATAKPWATDATPIEAENWVIREVDEPWIEIALIHGLRKNQNDRDWDGFCARYGIPSTFFVAPPGADEIKMAEFQETAEDLAADGAGVVPNGSEVITHEAKAEGDVFGKKTTRHDSAIVLAATGGLLTMLAQSGSGTLAGGAHSDSWQDLVAGIAAEVSEAFQEQLDKPWLTEKFPGQPVAVFFELAFPEEKADSKATMETVKLADEAGYEVDEKWLAETVSMPLKRKTVVAPPPAVVSPGAADPGTLGKPIKNRFEGGTSSARDRAEATQLAETAIQGALDVTRETLSPLAPDIEALIALAEDDQATEADFIALAEKVEQLLPELLNKAGVDALAKSLEDAMGTATAMGARATIRQRAKV